MNPKKLLLAVGLLLALSQGNASGQEPQKDQQNSNSSIDITEIVTTALVLSFGYKTLQSFREKSG